MSAHADRPTCSLCDRDLPPDTDRLICGRCTQVAMAHARQLAHATDAIGREYDRDRRMGR